MLRDEQAVHHATESTLQPFHAIDKAKDVLAKILDSDMDTGKLIPQNNKKELRTSQSRKQEFQKVASVSSASSKTKIPRARKEGFFLPDAELSPGNKVWTTEGQLGAKQDTGSNQGEDVCFRLFVVFSPEYRIVCIYSKESRECTLHIVLNLCNLCPGMWEIRASITAPFLVSSMPI